MNSTTKDAKRSIRKRRGLRFAFRFNLLLSLLLVAVLWGMVNYLSYRYYARTDISHGEFYKLSEKTAVLLNGLTNDVMVTVFFKPENSIYQDVVLLLDEYAYASEHIKVEKVDPHRNLARTRELSSRYSLEEPGAMVFECDGRVQVVVKEDMVRAEYDQISEQMEPSAVYFLGEVIVSSAIREVTQGLRPLVYFLQGHGERDIESYDEFNGYSEISQVIRHDNAVLQPLVLGEKRGIPSDCNALIIAGPSKKISQPEIDILQSYLERSGRLLLLLEPLRGAGLEPLLEDWGVKVHDDLVIDASRTMTGRELVVSSYGRHPITEPLKQTSTIFYMPRSVESIAELAGGDTEVDKPRAVSLASCSAAGWAESDLKQQPLMYDVQDDRPGPISIAVAVEKGPVEGLDVGIQPTRMVVVGDSDFIGNGALTGGNTDFLLSSLNWLLEREELMAIAPKPFTQYRLTVSQSQRQTLFFIIVLGIPAAVGVLGLLVWAGRRV